MRERPILIRLLVTLLLLQWGTAFAHCFRPAAATLHATICTADGLRSLALGPDGNPALPDGGQALLCPLCLSPTAAPPPEPAAIAAPRLLLVQASEPQAPPPREAPPAPPPRCQPRAPPPPS